MWDFRKLSFRSRVQFLVGAFLCVTAATGALFWILIVTFSAGDSSGTFGIGSFSGSGLLDALLATPTVVAVLATQTVLGVGLMERRPWVSWFGPMFVIGGLLAGGLERFTPPGSWVTLILPLLATVPTGILGWSRRRLSRPERRTREVLP